MYVCIVAPIEIDLFFLVLNSTRSLISSNSKQSNTVLEKIMNTSDQKSIKASQRM